MLKEEVIVNFWSSFGWKAYDENAVPDDAEIPRITYSVVSDSLNHPVMMTASLWDRSYSWESVTRKSREIAQVIHEMYPSAIECDDGRVYITAGNPFAQRMYDSNDDSIRRLYLNLEVEYFTEY